MDQDIPHDAAPPRAEARDAARRPSQARLDAEARRRIGLNLRVLYAGTLTQPIPERFEALVAAFAARSAQEASR